MALENSSITSISSARRWVDRICNTFKDEVVEAIDNLPPVCVFEVPKALTSQKPDAYTPQLIGMGPYHHLRPELYHMERYKLAAVKEILNPSQIADFPTLVIDRLKAVGQRIRACYNKFMNYDEDTLAWIIAIDGLFLLNAMESVASGDGTESMFVDSTIFTRDMMMLENQIPLILLKEIRRAVRPDSYGDREDDRQLLLLMLAICKANLPLGFEVDQRIYEETPPLHLLDLMYNLLVQNSRSNSVRIQGINLVKESFSESRSEGKRGGRKRNEEEDEDDEGVLHNVEAILDVVEAIDSKRASQIIQPFKVIASMPWSNISGMFRSGTKGNAAYLNEQINIPSVSYMWHYGNIKCLPFKGCINEVRFVEGERTLYLPIITMNASTEVIIRNLVAYEASMARSNLEFSRYINLMNGIIDVPEDARLLRQNGVIKGDLSDEEVTELFNSMKRYYVKQDESSNIEKAIEMVNKYYDKRTIVWVYRRIRRDAYVSWKFLALILSLAVTILVIFQSFCSLYGCHRLW